MQQDYIASYICAIEVDGEINYDVNIFSFDRESNLYQLLIWPYLLSWLTRWFHFVMVDSMVSLRVNKGWQYT